MESLELLYEGKSKKVYQTKDEDVILIHYKDDATAYNGIKKAEIKNKGICNNNISSYIFKYLKENGVDSHFISQVNDCESLCKKLTIIPLEVICRNVCAGTMAKRLGIKEGTVLNNTVYELCYKDDNLGDPLVNEHHAVALGLVSYEELKVIYNITYKVNELLKDLFNRVDITLVDFKIEFGRDKNNNIILADEISPDSCRLWDKNTNDRLDKDRFRKDLGHVSDAYKEIYRRLGSLK